jgi:hypothetical protein
MSSGIPLAQRPMVGMRSSGGIVNEDFVVCYHQAVNNSKFLTKHQRGRASFMHT